MNHPAAHRSRPTRPRGRLAAAAAVVAALTALLGGCGIRNTALPVDAGQGASRTACPPAPGVSLSRLDHDAYAAAPTVDLPRSSPVQEVPSSAPTFAPATAASTAPTTSPSPNATVSCLQTGAATGSPPAEAPAATSSP